MNPFAKLDAWGKRHHPIWIEAIRILLGLILIFKGFYFLHDNTLLLGISTNDTFGQLSSVIAYSVPFINIIGGVFIVIGLITRISLLCELPVLLGAVFFVNLHNTTGAGNTELLFSIITLVLAVFFLVEGPGIVSLDYHMRAGKRRNLKDKIKQDIVGAPYTNPDGAK